MVYVARANINGDKMRKQNGTMTCVGRNVLSRRGEIFQSSQNALLSLPFRLSRNSQLKIGYVDLIKLGYFETTRN